MDLSQVTNLGIGGLSLMIMWWMYKSAAEERAKNYAAMETLQSDIRNKISGQLQENTNALMQHSNIMTNVLELLTSINRRRQISDK